MAFIFLILGITKYKISYQNEAKCKRNYEFLNILKILITSSRHNNTFPLNSMSRLNMLKIYFQKIVYAY